MTQEEKQLLLIDLCARLPYGVKVKCHFEDEPYTLLSINWDKEIVVIGFMNVDTYVTSKQKLVKIKPYIRPLSSMTEEEMKECEELGIGYNIEDSFGERFELIQSYHLFDWLNKKMFDYRGLISKDLAISTEVFNPYKDFKL